MLGKSAQEAVGSHILNYLSKSGLIEVMEAGKPQVGQKLLLNGYTCITNRTPIVRDGVIIGAVGVFQDISDLDNISRELTAVKNLSQELDAIIEYSYDGIYVTYGQGNTTRVTIKSTNGLPGSWVKSLSAAICGILSRTDSISIGYPSCPGKKGIGYNYTGVKKDRQACNRYGQPHLQSGR